NTIPVSNDEGYCLRTRSKHNEIIFECILFVMCTGAFVSKKSLIIFEYLLEKDSLVILCITIGNVSTSASNSSILETNCRLLYRALFALHEFLHCVIVSKNME